MLGRGFLKISRGQGDGAPDSYRRVLNAVVLPELPDGGAGGIPVPRRQGQLKRLALMYRSFLCLLLLRQTLVWKLQKVALK